MCASGDRLNGVDVMLHEITYEMREWRTDRNVRTRNKREAQICDEYSRRPKQLLTDAARDPWWRGGLMALREESYGRVKA